MTTLQKKNYKAMKGSDTAPGSLDHHQIGGNCGTPSKAGRKAFKSVGLEN